MIAYKKKSVIPAYPERPLLEGILTARLAMANPIVPIIQSLMPKIKKCIIAFSGFVAGHTGKGAIQSFIESYTRED